MQRLLFERFVEEENVEIYSPVALLNLVRISSRENLSLALLDPMLIFLERSVSYEDRGHSDHTGKSARFWLSQIKHIHLRHTYVAVFCKDQQLFPFLQV